MKEESKRTISGNTCYKVNKEDPQFPQIPQQTRNCQNKKKKKNLPTNLKMSKGLSRPTLNS